MNNRGQWCGALVAVVLVVAPKLQAANCPGATCGPSITGACDITSPGTYSVDAIFTATADDAICVSADNVIIVGNGNTITYCDTGPGLGIAVAVNTTSLEISGLTLTQGAFDPAASGEANQCHAIRLKSASSASQFSGWNIHDNTININQSGFASGAGTHAISMANFTSNSTGNTVGPNNVINLAGTSGVKGITIEGSGTATWEGVIRGNTINVANIPGESPAGRNFMILLGNDTTTGEVDGNTINMAATNGAIQGIAELDSNGWYIHDNTITMSSTHSRGIVLDGSDNNSIQNNTITMDAGAAGGEASAGIRIRFGSDSNIIVGNVITATAGAPESIPLRIGGTESAPGHDTPLAGNVVRNNNYQSNFRAVSIEEGIDSLRFFGNTIASDLADTGIPIFVQNGGGAEVAAGISFTDDTINGQSTTCAGLGPSCKVRLLGNVDNITFCDVVNLDATGEPGDEIRTDGAGTKTFSFATGCTPPAATAPMQPLPNSP